VISNLAGIFRSNWRPNCGFRSATVANSLDRVIPIETLREEVAKLPFEEREAFAEFVLGTLPALNHYVSDEEAMRRWEEMESGAEPGISSEELWRRLHARRTNDG
jgi:hypothetical protein